MNTTRREVLGGLGRGMLFLGLGPAVAVEAGLRPRFGRDGDELHFGDMEPLVAFMQETGPDEMLPILVEKLKQGVTLHKLVAAGALANARTFGGENYNGYHAFMAMVPAFEMAKFLPKEEQALPLLKVLYRNSSFIQDSGGRKYEVLKRISGDAIEANAPGESDGRSVRAALRKVDVDAAEYGFARIASQADPVEAFEQLQDVLYDDIDVHRVVLAERVFDTLRFIGDEHAHTMLRTSVRHCIDVEERRQSRGRPEPSLRQTLPRLLEQYELTDGAKGTKAPDDAYLEELANDIFAANRDEGAERMAKALAEGYEPKALGEALVLAGNRLLLNDRGRTRAERGKPKGSVHGASVGVHASDAALAWRGVAAFVGERRRPSSLIVGAYHTAGQSRRVGRDAFDYKSKLDEVGDGDVVRLCLDLDEAIRAGDQARSVAIVERYEQTGEAPREIFDTLLAHSIEPDGALHAEKYYYTAHVSFVTARPAFRWRHAKGLARVCASQAGFEAPGLEEARKLLKA